MWQTKKRTKEITKETTPLRQIPDYDDCHHIWSTRLKTQNNLHKRHQTCIRILSVTSSHTLTRTRTRSRTHSHTHAHTHTHRDTHTQTHTHTHTHTHSQRHTHTETHTHTHTHTHRDTHTQRHTHTHTHTHTETHTHTHTHTAPTWSSRADEQVQVIRPKAATFRCKMCINPCCGK